ncbi:MAG: hypothetical protein KGM47_01710, partial [Acidobacteriota bacterium]|nr:hypothetical protein [Acidobacteriota bacterium]
MRKAGVWIGVMVLACAAECRPQTVTTAAAAGRKDLSLTLYSSGSDMVRDTRAVKLPAGVINLKFPDVAERIETGSLQVVSVTAPDQLSALGETYSYDLLNPQRLLDAYVGKTLTLVLTRTENGSQVEKPVEATLVAANPGPVWRIDGKIETGLRVDHYVFPEIPANLDAKPSLILRLKNEHAGEQNVRVTYLTNGMNWNANYILTASPDWKSANLAARASINNQSGADYP